MFLWPRLSPGSLVPESWNAKRLLYLKTGDVTEEPSPPVLLAIEVRIRRLVVTRFGLNENTLGKFSSEIAFSSVVKLTP